MPRIQVRYLCDSYSPIYISAHVNNWMPYLIHPGVHNVGNTGRKLHTVGVD